MSSTDGRKEKGLLFPTWGSNPKFLENCYVNTYSRQSGTSLFAVVETLHGTVEFSRRCS